MRAAMWLWALESGRLIRRFEFPRREETAGSGVLQVAFSPDGRRVLSSGWRYAPGAAEAEAELLLWRLPDELGFWLLGTEKP